MKVGHELSLSQDFGGDLQETLNTWELIESNIQQAQTEKNNAEGNLRWADEDFEEGGEEDLAGFVHGPQEVYVFIRIDDLVDLVWQSSRASYGPAGRGIFDN